MITYIDGYNLYHGLLEAGLGSSRWLDLPKLGRSLLKPGQHLVLTRYFTTRVKGDPSKARRQARYIDALTTRGGIEIDFGHFLSKRVTCHSCGHTWTKSEEKKTDVNIAVRMLEDTYDDHFDTAIVISGDSDLATPVETIRKRYPHKRVLVAFPPKRYSHELRRVANVTFRIFNRNHPNKPPTSNRHHPQRDHPHSPTRMATNPQNQHVNQGDTCRPRNPCSIPAARAAANRTGRKPPKATYLGIRDSECCFVAVVQQVFVDRRGWYPVPGPSKKRCERCWHDENEVDFKAPDVGSDPVSYRDGR